MKRMFCPKCGAGEQTAEAYCKRCGEWLPDVDALNRPRLFRKRSREERIQKVRMLEAISTGLSLCAAGIIISILATGRNLEMLSLAAIACILVAVYQIANLYLGYTIQRPIDKSRETDDQIAQVETSQQQHQLDPASQTNFIHPQSVVENTTDLLEPIPRKSAREQP